MTDREKLKVLIEDYYQNTFHQTGRGLADHLLANGVVVREKGEWLGKEEKLWNLEFPLVTVWECSKCGVWGHYTENFCPNCGADMRKGENG